MREGRSGSKQQASSIPSPPPSTLMQKYGQLLPHFLPNTDDPTWATKVVMSEWVQRVLQGAHHVHDAWAPRRSVAVGGGEEGKGENMCKGKGHKIKRDGLLRGGAKSCHMAVVNLPSVQVKADAMRIGPRVTHLQTSRTHICIFIFIVLLGLT